jgi:hypothetical protein
VIDNVGLIVGDPVFEREIGGMLLVERTAAMIDPSAVLPKIADFEISAKRSHF